MKSWIAVVLAVLLTGCAANVGRETATPYARLDVLEATAAWAAAYNSRDPAKITALYAPEASFWGTTAKTLASTPPAIAEYFKTMPQTPNNRVEFGPQVVHVYGDMATSSGYYTFKMVQGGKPVEVPARFTFAFKHDGRRWLIVDHHSSRIP